MKRIPAILPAMFLFFILLLSGWAWGESPPLTKGMEEYKKQNFEEALDLLISARKLEPQSTTAAFFLGMTYKQLNNFQQAADNFRDAVKYKPRIKQALVELIESLYRIKTEASLTEADKWIETAESENIFPAKTLFLKGLLLQEKGKFAESITAFEKAKALNPKMTQAADMQIGMVYVKSRQLDKAKSSFDAVVLQDPQSDLADYARRYVDMVQQRMVKERPWRFTLSVIGQYDDNVVLKPLADEVAPNVSGEDAWATNFSGRIDYVPTLPGNWLFNAQYAFFANSLSQNATTHNSIINTVSAAPGYNFGRFALNIPMAYTHVQLRQPSYEDYLESFSVGPMFRTSLSPEHFLEFYGGYDWKDYRQEALIPVEDRDANGFRTHASWIWTYGEGGFFNLKYEYSDSNSSGENWDNYGNRFSLNIGYPLMEKLYLQASGQAFYQRFRNVHTVFGKKREDDVYSASTGLSWTVYKNINLIFQYSHTRANSNFSIYQYERNVFSAGIEYRY